jgi:hypothetical protein
MSGNSAIVLIFLCDRNLMICIEIAHLALAGTAQFLPVTCQPEPFDRSGFDDSLEFGKLFLQLGYLHFQLFNSLGQAICRIGSRTV